MSYIAVILETDCLHLLQSQGQRVSRALGPELCQQRLCKSSAYLSSESCIDRQWGGPLFTPDLAFGLSDRKVLLLSSIIVRINDPLNNSETCLSVITFPISSSFSTTASSGNQMPNVKQLAQAEPNRNAVILVKSEKGNTSKSLLYITVIFPCFYLCSCQYAGSKSS